MNRVTSSARFVGITSQERTMFKRIPLLTAGLLALAFALPAAAQSAICYNCPPEWADWGTQLKLIKEKTGITVHRTTRIPGNRFRNWWLKKPIRLRM